MVKVTLIFLAGMLLGSVTGTLFMCLFQINRQRKEHEDFAETYYQKADMD